MISLVSFPLVDEPRLDKSAEESLPYRRRSRLQSRQEFREFVHREVHPLGEVHEGQGVSCVGRPSADLGDGGVEFRQQIGGDFRAFDGFRDTPQQPDLEGLRRIRHGRIA